MKVCIALTPELVKVHKLKLVYIGQWEGDTKWKECLWKLLVLLMFYSINILIFFNSNIEKNYLIQVEKIFNTKIKK